ncbi:hypothetical protein J1N35_036766 [Gossypium stocksii]|uniref:Uncharacterized protein n=1 Tax=Gossypium stocksii TaxID=47602 RepID=A0A9D3UIT6_9ROSI|nr:hypothetical protein J1N35_036766 [Gossypium stocksii]
MGHLEVVAEAFFQRPKASSHGQRHCRASSTGHTNHGPVQMGLDAPVAHYVMGPASGSSKASLVRVDDNVASRSDVRIINYEEPYIPMPISSFTPTMWCPDSDATNHVS